MKRRILSTFLAVCLLAGLLPGTALAKDAAQLEGVTADGTKIYANTYGYMRTVTPPHAHDNVTFTAWDRTDSLPTDPGNYYLTKDVALDATWRAPSGETRLCLNGKTITMNGDEADAVSVPSGATLHLYDGEDNAGKITHSEHMWGSGVLVEGAFYLHGGSITGNTAYYLLVPMMIPLGGHYGGGVCVNYNGTFTMSGGSITGNDAPTVKGGGVAVLRSGTFTMTGGTISGNKAVCGGGVHLEDSAAFTMTGGAITGNTVDQSGGGVFMFGYIPTFTMSGGSITGNTACFFGGGGVDVDTITLSGAPVITGNTVDEAADNLYLENGETVTIGTGGLTEGASIGVTTQTAPTKTTPVNITGANSADYSQYFISDSADYAAQNSGEGDAQVVQLAVKPAHSHDMSVDCGGEAPVTFEAWTATDSLPTTPGHYYLTGNVTLSSRWYGVQTGDDRTIDLCLNGKTVTFAGQTAYAYVSFQSRLNLCDCQEGGKLTSAARGDAPLQVGGGAATLYGGTIERAATYSSSEVYYHAVDVLSGGFHLAGGALRANGIPLYVRFTGTAYLSGAPTLTVTSGDFPNIRIEGNSESFSALYAHGENGGAAYAGDTLAIIDDSEGVGDGTVIVHGVTDGNQDKFTLQNVGFFMAREGDGLIAHPYAITTQPTAQSPTVVTNHPDGASYQWCTADVTAVKDTTTGATPGSSASCDEDTGAWTTSAGDSDQIAKYFSLPMKAGDSLLLTPMNNSFDPDSGQFMLLGEGYENQAWSSTIEADGKVWLTAPADDTYTFIFYGSGAVPTVQTEHLKLTPVSGQTTASLTTTAAGTYACQITWPNGTVLVSDPVKIEAPAHVHDNLTFTAWTDANALPGAAGNYYLDTDVTLSSFWQPVDGVKLCLNGHVVKTAAGVYYPVVYVGAGVTLDIYDCKDYDATTVRHRFSVDDTGLWTLDENGTKALKGGVITGGRNGSTAGGGGVQVFGTLNLYGGNIAGNRVSGSGNYGGGVYVCSGAFNMYGGSVVGNVAFATSGPGSGGGVAVADGASFTMQGRTVEGRTYGPNVRDNTAHRGGGVYNNGAMTMTRGSNDDASPYVQRNTALSAEIYGAGYGGGIYNTSQGVLNILMGSVVGDNTGGNAARNGGGIYNMGTLTLERGACVSYNTATGTGGGVYGSDGCTYQVNGAVIVNNNTAADKPSNFYLSEGQTIAVKNRADSGGDPFRFAWLYVTTEVKPTAASPVNITTEGFEEYREGFYSDDTGYEIVKNSSTNVIQLGKKATKVKVAGTAVTSDNAADVLGDGKVRFDADTNTLTLDSANFTAAEREMGIWAKGDLTIKLVGASTVASADGRDIIKVEDGGLTIQGDGSLTAASTGEDTSLWGIYADGDVVISGATVATGGVISCAIQSDRGSVAIANSEVTVEGYHEGITADQGVTITNSTVTAVSSNGTAIRDNSDSALTITGSTVTATGKNTGILGGGTLDITNSTVTTTGDTVAINAVLTVAEGMVVTEGDSADNAAVDQNKDYVTGARPGLCTYVKVTAGSVTPPPTPATYTVIFNAQGGSAVSSQTVTGGGKATRPANDPTRSGYTFGGWYKEAACTTAWNFTSDTVTANVTLYAKWTEKTYSVSGTVEDNTNAGMDGVDVKLVQGSGDPLAADQTKNGGEYSFTGIRPGVYNIVATKEGRTMTKLVTVVSTDLTDQRLTMPAGDVNSVLEVKETTVINAASDVTKTVVGGLEDEAAAVKAGSGGATSVTVTMTVEAKAEAAAPNAPDIKAEAEADKTLEYIEITVEKKVDEEDAQLITETHNLLTIVIPFNFEGKNKDSVRAYRYHNGNVDTLTTTPNAENEKITLGTDSITLMVKKFSTYAIGYTETTSEPEPTPTPRPSSSGPTYYTLTATADEGGTIAPSGKVSVRSRTSKTFDIAPAEGYTIADVLVDGQSVGAVSSYTFEKVTKAHTIEAVFEKAEGYAVCPRDESCPMAAFDDAEAAAWYHDGVHFCLEHGLMVGTSDTTFAPAMETSRAMIATILWRLEDSPKATKASGFADVAAGAWYAEAVAWAAEKGVIEGYGNGKFGPNDPITREQLAAMLYRYEQKINGGGFTGSWMFLLDFVDAADVSQWADEAMHYMTMHKVIEGKGNKTLDPKGQATRAEAAAILQRYMENAEK